MSALNGNPEEVQVAGSADPAVFDPSFDVLGLNVNRLTVSCGVTAAGSRVSQFCLPLSISRPFE